MRFNETIGYALEKCHIISLTRVRDIKVQREQVIYQTPLVKQTGRNSVGVSSFLGMVWSQLIDFVMIFLLRNVIPESKQAVGLPI